MSDCILKNWHLSATGFDPNKAPELQIPKLCGEVYGHPRFKDGSPVVTSGIVGIEGEVLLTKSGSRYILENPAPDYEKMFPNSKDRLLKQIAKVVAGNA